jgi:hypothetical protein
LKDREQRVLICGKHSSWTKVASGVPQGSVLGPILFLIFINDLDDSIQSRVLKFADDTKILRTVGTQEDIDGLRQDLINLGRWSEEWLMLFNVDKCKVMHIGYNNPRAVLKLNNKELLAVTEEKDLGVIVDNGLKFSHQCADAVSKANRVLGMIKRSFSYRSKDVILQLYKSLVRPKLDYCVQAWRPHLQKDIDLLEGVQRRATKLVYNLKNLSYKERLRS